MTDYPFLSHFLFKVYQQSVIMKTVFNATDAISALHGLEWSPPLGNVALQWRGA